jgi:uncharacterized membrane protein YdjX (TVP38/TMEM64 family)
MKQKREPVFYINLVVFAVFIAALVFVTVKFTPSIMGMIKDPEQFRDLLLSYGSMSAFVYMLFQVLQVVIAVIPGEVVQIAGGYVFGAVWGTALTVAGILVGTAIVFFATRLFGYKFVKSLIPQKDLEKFNFLVNGEKAEIAMFVLFLIPGLPKDVLTYIAGLTPIKPLRFLLISSIARLPGILGSAIIGASLQNKNYVAVIVVSVIAIVLFVGGLLLRDRIINKIHDAKKKIE